MVVLFINVFTNYRQRLRLYEKYTLYNKKKSGPISINPISSNYGFLSVGLYLYITHILILLRDVNYKTRKKNQFFWFRRRPHSNVNDVFETILAVLNPLLKLAYVSTS